MNNEQQQKVIQGLQERIDSMPEDSTDRARLILTAMRLKLGFSPRDIHDIRRQGGA